MSIRAVIAEDDFRVANIHERFLDKIEGIQVVGKGLNAKETMEILRKENPDLLLLDVYMPDMIGTDLLPIIRKEFPNLDIMMITAATDKEVFQTALHYGVVSYLIKPVTMDRFSKSIEEYVNKVRIMEGKLEVNQELVDMVYQKSLSLKSLVLTEAALPKGIDEITLKKVRRVLRESEDGFSAEQMGEQIGASRTTARRYLEYLISIEECKAEVLYGTIGRPERRYFRLN